MVLIQTVVSSIGARTESEKIEKQEKERLFFSIRGQRGINVHKFEERYGKFEKTSHTDSEYLVVACWQSKTVSQRPEKL